MKVILCNIGADDAGELARMLVQQRFAACVNIVPGVRSVYRWDGKVCEDTESTLLIKAPAEGLTELKEALLKAHPYEVPEFVVVDVDVKHSHQPYVKWVRDSCTESVD